MTDAELLREEIAELEAQIFRLRGSMGKADNGVKLQRLAIVTRLCNRCKRALANLSARGEAA
ncbi:MULTISPECIES: hypothetical protein [unclassified Shinella]|uniref:hypothetical protein n=1 Tax=unclassified Shinella TaxID=2643062 RepID=UPI0006814F0E|nr:MULTISPECIES: hypothetical protein [unclassified Shinella]KNY18495.1 hypothetical protein AKG11_05125 [Shinella sp. SUS2]KOC71808.1 hypothetical protein AKG10_30925 [Shinella sp. GWS1]MCO5152552.1 hypothetical protein [Shinella sp.]MDC7261846.1 hypothetical protein [Shinella sp. HY16]MDC7268741.1 hypothetical protein [Shinella sp. YZ44]